MEYLLHPKPFQDESLKGYVARLTLLNHYELSRWIYQDCKLLAESRAAMEVNVNLISPTKLSLEMLAQRTHNEESDLWNLTYYSDLGDFNEVRKNQLLLFTLRNNALMKSESKYCPFCLQDHLYFRKLWELKIYNICHIHNTLLITSCPQCNSSVKTNPIGSCATCGYIYANAYPQFVSESYTEVERTLYNKLNKIQKKSQNPLLNLEFNVFVYLIIYFANKVKVAYPELNEDSRSINYKETAKAYKIFDDWPNNFFDFLEYFKKQAVGRKVYRFVPYILNNFIEQHKSLAFIVKELEKYVIKDMNGFFGINFNKLNREGNWMSVETVKRDLNCTHTTIKKLIEEGPLISKEINISPDIKYYFIEKKSLKKYKESLKQQLRFKDTKQLLGIADNTLNNLIEAQILTENIVSHSARVDRYIDKNSLDSFLEGLNSKIIITNEDENKLISYKSTSEIFGKANSSIVELINCIFSGKLTPFIQTQEFQGSLHSLYFSKEEVKKCLSDRKQYTITEIARILKTGTRAISTWVNRGLLKAVVLKKITYIYEEDFNSFLEIHISLNEICNLLSINDSKAKELLSEHNLKPVSGNTIDGSGRYLFHRKEVDIFINSYLKSKDKNPLLEKDFYNSDELAQLLDISKKDIRGWLSRGFLVSSKVKGVYRVDKSDLNNFKETYIYVDEIKWRANISHRHISSFLGKYKITAVSGPSIDGGRRYLYLRSQVEPVISSIFSDG